MLRAALVTLIVMFLSGSAFSLKKYQQYTEIDENIYSPYGTSWKQYGIKSIYIRTTCYDSDKLSFHHVTNRPEYGETSSYIRATCHNSNNFIWALELKVVDDNNKSYSCKRHKIRKSYIMQLKYLKKDASGKISCDWKFLNDSGDF